MSVKPQVQLIVLLTAALLAYGIFSSADQQLERNMSTDRPAEVALPPAVFFDKEGNPQTIDAFKGQVVLLNLWATWCPPCVAELEALDTLQAKLRAQGVAVVAVSLDRTSVATVAAFLHGRGLDNLGVYWDKDREIPARWRYEGIPASFLIDRNGKLVKSYMGAQEWDKEPLISEIAAAAKAK